MRGHTKVDRPSRESLAEFEGDAVALAEEEGVSRKTAATWLTDAGLYEHESNRAVHASELARRLWDMSPEEFSREYVPERYRRD